MSIIDRARNSAGATLEQGKSTVGSTVGTVSSRVRAVPAGTRSITRGAVTLARRQAYAAVGASDAIVATVTRQRDAASRVQQKVVSAATSLRTINPAATVGRVKDGTAQAKDAYAKLAVRGEQVATDLRHDPVLVRVIRGADTRAANAANGVTSVTQKVRARALAQAKREAAATTSTPVRVTPANKVPAHRTTVRKASAGEAPVSTTPTHRAAAHETATRQAAAKKAAATRKAAADKAAATRKAAAKKAAATRKKTAAARNQATKTRQTAAVKAAATRKRNAATA